MNHPFFTWWLFGWCFSISSSCFSVFIWPRNFYDIFLSSFLFLNHWVVWVHVRIFLRWKYLWYLWQSLFLEVICRVSKSLLNQSQSTSNNYYLMTPTEIILENEHLFLVKTVHVYRCIRRINFKCCFPWGFWFSCPFGYRTYNSCLCCFYSCCYFFCVLRCYLCVPCKILFWVCHICSQIN